MVFVEYTLQFSDLSAFVGENAYRWDAEIAAAVSFRFFLPHDDVTQGIAQPRAVVLNVESMAHD